jgi:sulfur carrier protein ThiS adenylyltransferase
MFEKRPRVAIVGLGGLGSTVVRLIDAPTLVLFDDDTVGLDNLGRQQYTEQDIGKRKVDCMRDSLRDRKVVCRPVRITKYNLKLLDAELVLDCTDDLEMKYLLNDHCVTNRIPLIIASAAGDRGFVKYVSRGSCLRCMKKDAVPETSATAGILNATVYMAAAIQAKLANNYLNSTITDRLISFDVWNETIRLIDVRKRTDCQVCR